MNDTPDFDAMTLEEIREWMEDPENAAKLFR
jgi:hypothetical protein